MARTRTIKPGFFKNEYLAELPMEARLLFIGLWCLADKDGRLEDRPKRIKAEVFPFDNVDVDELLNSLATTQKGQDEPFVLRYTADGVDCLQIVKFAEHQRCHVNETPSELPTYGDSGKDPSTREKNGALGKRTQALGQKCPSSLDTSSLDSRLLDTSSLETSSLDSRSTNPEYRLAALASSSSASPSPDRSRPVAQVGDVQAVVNHFQVHHPKARPGQKERRLIAARLKDGFSHSDLCEAIDGMHQTPHNLGVNERNTPYLTLCIALRDSSQVERFIANNRAPPAASKNANTRAAEAAIAAFVGNSGPRITNPAIEEFVKNA